MQPVSRGDIEREITVTVPEGATPEEEKRPIDAAVNREVNSIVDDLLGDVFKK